MNKLRQWINRDDGRWFQVGNENLNYLQIIGYGFMIVGLLIFPIRQRLFPEFPKWIHFAIFALFFVFVVAGEKKKKNR